MCIYFLINVPQIPNYLHLKSYDRMTFKDPLDLGLHCVLCGSRSYPVRHAGADVIKAVGPQVPRDSVEISRDQLGAAGGGLRLLMAEIPRPTNWDVYNLVIPTSTGAGFQPSKVRCRKTGDEEKLFAWLRSLQLTVFPPDRRPGF